jgi:DNA-binding response OmpR family regulator
VTLKEFEVLKVLLENPDKVLPYSTFAESLWPAPTDRSRRNLSVLIHNLRRKLADSCPFVIKTIRGRGYGLIRDRASSGEIAWRPG